jgi:hypothetical protein
MVPIGKIFDKFVLRISQATVKKNSPNLKGNFYGTVNINTSIADQVEGRKLIRIANETNEPGRPIIKGRTFKDADIWGPALIAPMDNNCAFVNCGFEGDVKSLFWEIEPNQLLIGVVGLQACEFINCNFKGIAIVGTAEIIKRFKDNLGA